MLFRVHRGGSGEGGVNKVMFSIGRAYKTNAQKEHKDQGAAELFHGDPPIEYFCSGRVHGTSRQHRRDSGCQLDFRRPKGGPGAQTDRLFPSLAGVS